MANPLSVHWIPAHRGSIGGKTDAQWFAAWDPAFVKIITDNETVPYLEDVPPAAQIVVRNYPMSELGHDRGFATTAATPAAPAAATPAAPAPFPQNGTPRDQRVSGSGAFASGPAPSVVIAGLTSKPEDVGVEHAAICNRIAQWCEGRGVPRSRLVFEGLNEPMLWSVEPPAQVARYYRQFLISLHGYNLRGVAGNFGVGWPGNGGVQDAPVQWSFWQPVVDVMLAGERPDYLGLHEYWALNGVAENWRWWAGRYEQCPFNIPILITETGIDTGVTGHYYGGWLDLPGQMTERATRYVGELAWYWQKCRADGRIKGIFPFTYDRGSDTWVNFDIRNEDLLKELVARKAEFPAAAVVTPPPTPPPPTPPPSGLEQALRNAAWNKAGIAYNPDAAFPKYARANNLGVPMTGEFDVTVAGVTYRVQGFAGGIVYTKVGDWANLKQLIW